MNSHYNEKQVSLIAVARYIESHYDEPISLSQLSKKFQWSPTGLQKAFKQVFGLSPRAFQEGIRQQQFKALLKEHASVTDAIFAAGYGSTSRVYENAENLLGMTPKSYSAGAPAERIHYTSGQTAFGQLLLAATSKGVCFAMFDQSHEALLGLLGDEFPHAERIGVEANQDKRLLNWFTAIDRTLTTNSSLPSIPLDLQGTVFQVKVWEFIRTVARGKTVSYKEVANAIGKPSAVRAVGTAVGSNRVALLVPCHRVLRSDGGIGGYRWGVDRKERLLQHEQTG